MADETPQAGNETPPQSGNGPGEPDVQVTPEEPFDKDRALATITKLREFEKLSKQQARELETLRSRVKEAEDAEKTELQRAQERVAALEKETAQLQQERREIKTRAAIERIARTLDIVDEDAAYRLLDLTKVEYDGENPTNIDTLLKQLLQAKPYLAKQPQGGGNGSPANPGRGNGSGTNPLLEQIQKAGQTSGADVLFAVNRDGVLERGAKG